jgi:hypothetical protein
VATEDAPVYATVPATAPTEGQAPEWGQPTASPAQPAAPVDAVPFQPGEAHVAPELRRRSRKAVVAANFMIVFVVVAVVAIALIGWNAFGGSGGRSTSGVPANLRVYAAGIGGLPYKTANFTVRLPDSYKVDSGSMPVGGYDVKVTGATARVDDMVIAVASGSLPAGAAQFAQSHLQYVGQQSVADMGLSFDSGDLKTQTWHGRNAYDIDAGAKDVRIHVRLVVVGTRYIVFVVAGPQGSNAVMAALLDSYQER